MNDPASAVATDPLLRRGPCWAVIAQGLPLAIGLASHAVVNLVDLAMVGRLGDDAVQAAHVASTWNFLPMLLGNCVSTALLARLSGQLGRGQHDAARRDNLASQWFMVWLSIAVGVLSSVTAAWQVDATGMHGAVRSDALHYLVVSNLGCLPMFVLMQTTAAMRAAGEARMPLLLLLLANVVNLGLDALLLFGCETIALPSVGVVGAAYASFVSRALAAALGWWWLRRPRHALSLYQVCSPKLWTSVARPLLADAWPQAVQIGLRAAVVVVLTAVVQRRFGDLATVSLGIATRLDTIVLFGALGFANAATAYAGRAVAIGMIGPARVSGAVAGIAAMLFGSAFVVGYASAPAEVVSWFRPDPSPELVEATASYFRIAAWSQVLAAGALGAIGAVYGGGNMKAPLWVDLGAFAVVGSLLWRWLGAEVSLPSLYGCLVVAMLVVLVAQSGLVWLGRWARAR